MEGMSAFAGVYGREMRPQRRHMEIALFEAARSGDVQTFRSILSARPADHSVELFPGIHDFEATVVILHAADHEEESKEKIFGVTVGGNTVLHIAAQHGHLDLAKEGCSREPSLVAAVNTRLETPLHCCAREGHDHIVSHIIDTARSGIDEEDYDWLSVLRARNVHGETALHEALRFGHELVAKKLIEADNELASFVSEGMSTTLSPADMIKDAAADHKQLIYSADHDAGLAFPVSTDTSMSPLYLAVMTKSHSAVEALLQHDSSAFAGPGGRTALHAAVTRCQEITRMLLKWKPVLGRVVDESHSTPLHYAAANGDREMAHILLEHDPSVAYISDKDGFFPIHVAAGMDHVVVISEILDQCPDSCELVDHNGRSFLHVAAERSSGFLVVELIVNRKKRDLEMLMLNQRDNYGDTPMHLALRDNRALLTFTGLLKNRSSEISIMNNLGLTPLDLSILSLISKPGLGHAYNAREVVTGLLVNCGAIMSPRRLDHEIQWSYNKAYNEEMEVEKVTSMAKNVAIVSVLIATVSFAAGFTIPGGYKSDEGTSIMAKKYPFKVFLISNVFALLLSLIATMRITFIGIPSVDISLQMRGLNRSMWMLRCSVACMCMSFGMATLVVIAPKDRRIGYLVCILSLVAPFFHIVYMDWPLVNIKRIIIQRNGGLMIRSSSKVADPRAMKYWPLPDKRTGSNDSLVDELFSKLFSLLHKLASKLLGMSGVSERGMRPQRRQMGLFLLKVARTGDVEALKYLLPSAEPADTDELSSYNYEVTVVIDTEGDATHPADESKETIFGVTAGGNTVLHIAAEHGHLDFAMEVCRLESSLVAAVNTRLES
ncbi:hypothetical protein J5N97_027268 [Dioscorea zingiberensis]|uniref:PGG domain-containing protein n=1 Tax=Dioscorea zingiberensis TaxID=325984 RepID=A0A9D5C4I8_9LILI|nr:hypothetical protein J5N97_027268 [Dioscorea zingiberensis]